MLTGEPVEGGTDVDPTPVGVGDWVDTLGPEDRPTSMRHYVVTRTTPGSTLRVSAITQGGRDWESLHTAIYAGVPNSNRAFALGRQALADGEGSTT